MENIVILALEKLKNLSEIQDLGVKSLHLQNLAYFLLKNQNKLKIELNYPLFWTNLESVLRQGYIHAQSYDASLNHASKKIVLHNRATYDSFESDLILPSDLVLYLTNEDMPKDHRLLLEAICAHSTVYLSLNLVFNLPE